MTVEPPVVVEPAGLEVDVEVEALGSSDPEPEVDVAVGLVTGAGAVVVTDVFGMLVETAGCDICVVAAGWEVEVDAVGCV
jgi:hypothetical protein